MGRIIKFRGKDIVTNEWRHGNILFDNKGRARIASVLDVDGVDFPMQYFDVDVNTIGQFTELYDRHKKEIYDGDIVSYYEVKHRIVDIDDRRVGNMVEPYLQKHTNEVDYAAGGFLVNWKPLYAAALPAIEIIPKLLELKHTSYDIPVKEFKIEDESVIGFEVIGNIYDNPELLKKKMNIQEIITKYEGMFSLYSR